MGCGQSKINLYPRRSKHKSSSKKSATNVDMDESEEEGEEGEEGDEISTEQPEENAEPEEPEEPEDVSQHVLPIADHQPTFEVSISQQNFFKMLDEKIEQGKDYDSTSETEIQEEQERRRRLIEHWRGHSQSSQSSPTQSTPPPPPTPAAKRRLTRSVSKASERQCAPHTSKQCYRQEPPHTRHCHIVPATNDPRAGTSDSDSSTKSPLKRTQSAGSTWRNKPKVAPMPKPKTDNKDEAGAGCSRDSQITYNPTFQTHSPAKSQPHKAHKTAHPLSQQVTPSSSHIAPPQEYQDAEDGIKHITLTQVTSTTQSQIYYIHGNNAATSTSADIMQQRQQTAIHLQQYVAMKQAQQQSLTSYLQRVPMLPNAERPAPRLYEGEELAAQYGYPGFRPQSAPNRPGLVSDVTHAHTQMWSPLPPVMTTPWVGGQVPPEMQYYPQSQFVQMFRANSAGSAGTLTRYHKKKETEKTVQTISVVRGKPVGQIVSVGGQELAVTRASTDSPSPASVSTDSGVSPGTSAPSPKSSFTTTPPTTTPPTTTPPTTTPPTTSANETSDPKPKKNKSGHKRNLKVSKSLDS